MDTIPLNPAFVKSGNTQFILETIRAKSVSRVELSRLSGLSKPAVSAIVDALIREGIVTEMLRENTGRGRKPTLLSIVPYCLFSAGIVISREICGVGVTDLLGNIVNWERVRCENEPVSQTVDILSAALNGLLIKNNVDKSKVVGAGISMPGPADTVAGKILNPPNFDKWHNINITKMFSAALSLPAYLENQATAYAIAERLFGGSGQYANSVLLAVEDGIGSAVMVDGVPYNALNGFSPEFGHVSINYKGKPCTCGGTGCLELYASEQAALLYAKEKSLSVSRWEDIVDLAVTGNTDVLLVIEKIAGYLSVVIIDILNILSPDAVVIAGKYKYKPDILLGFIRKSIDNRYLFRPKNVDIIASALERDIFVLTSCSIVINRFFKSGL